MSAELPLGLVAAMDLGRLLGREGGLPWRLPSELKRFRARTLGAAVLLGRRTADSLPKPLPGRRNIVLTRAESYPREGFLVARDLDAALRLAEGTPRALVLGGAELYALALPRVRFAWLTLVHARLQGDTAFPRMEGSEWRCAAREPVAQNEGDEFAYECFDLERRAEGDDAPSLPWSELRACLEAP